ncbi:MAG: transcription antitermination factor NusB [Gemmatimonadota bacterium]
MRDRSRARGWALQMLYAWEARGMKGSPLDAMRDFVRERNVAVESRGYIEWLLGTVAEHREAIDRAVGEALTNWRLERLSAIDRNILRLAAAEMLFIEEVPPRVSIQEAIVLAEKYGTAESPRFVNGVLDALMHRADGGGGADVKG